MYDNISPELIRGIATHLPEAEKTSFFINPMPNMSGVGKQPKPPGVPAPTVGTKPKPPSPPGRGDSGAPERPSEGRESTKQAFLEAGLSPLLGGAAGAGLGYLAGTHLVNPYLQQRAATIQQQIQAADANLARLTAMKKASPWVAGAVGALVLATLAAKKARADEREKIETRKFWMAPENRGLLNEIQGAQTGFLPGEQALVNQQLPFY